MSEDAPPRRPRCVGAILAGGRSSRMGGAPKGLERVGGARMLDRVAAALAGAADELLLVANDPRAPRWLPRVRVVGDVHPGLGSVGGVHAALAHAGSAVLVVASDMPFVTAPLLRVLRETGEREPVDAVVPEGNAPGGVEPLCGYYAAGCLDAVERAIAAGERRAGGWLAAVRAHRLGRLTLAGYGDPDVLFANVNTPEELARAIVRADAPA